MDTPKIPEKRFKSIFNTYQLPVWSRVYPFLHYIRKKVPFDIKCVQTDNGTEFTNSMLNPGSISEFEQYLEAEKIAYKRIRPAIPRHNGKMEREQ